MGHIGFGILAGLCVAGFAFLSGAGFLTIFLAYAAAGFSVLAAGLIAEILSEDDADLSREEGLALASAQD